MSEVQDFGHPSVVFCPGGPALIRGNQTVQTSDGTIHRLEGPISALCRCGKSGSLPKCDGTHKWLPEHLRP